MKLRLPIGRSRPSSGRPGDVRGAWQVVAGAVLVPLGAAFILLGWYGAAHTPYVQQQIPYMVSGGFLGLGLMVVGGLLFFSHWLYRLYDQAALHHEQLVARLVGADREDGRSAGEGLAAVPDDEPGVVVATATGSNFHRPDCPVVTGRAAGVRVVSGEELAALRPCRICEPDGAVAPGA